MVIKGSARGGPAKLALHLERTDTNEKMRVAEMRGVAAKDLNGALREMDALGAALNTHRTLYHASINTRGDERMTPEQKAVAIDRLEERLGLTGQPRVVVEHTKKDRDHIHIVWSRTDLEHMRAIRCDHNYRTHEQVARDLEREFGHARVQGAHVERDGKARPARTPGHDEMQQAERTGLSPREAKEWITGLWRATDSGKAFKAAIEGQGWALARGDRRDFVLIDRTGQVHSLARRVEGATAADIRSRMTDVDRDSLPGVTAAQKIARARPAPAHVKSPRMEARADRQPVTKSATTSRGAKSTTPIRRPIAPAPARVAQPDRPRMGRAASKVAAKVAGGILGVGSKLADAIATGFEQLLGGGPAIPPQKSKDHAMPEPKEETPHEQSVRVDGQDKEARRQALIQQYGGEIPSGREAEVAAGIKRDEDRSR